jgi:hypothetical protein
VTASRLDSPGRALLLENVHDDAAFLLRDAGFDVERVAAALGEDELVEAVRDVAVLGLRSNTTVTRRVLESAPSLKAIGAFCIGTNQIDLSAATERGVAVFNAPFSNTRSVVELALSEVIALTRRLTDKNADMHAGVWDKSAVGSHEVRGRRLGVVGYGNIGSQLSVLAEALGMSVLFYDTADKLALGNAPPVRHPRGAARRGRRRLAPRRRADGQQRAVRRGAVREDAPRQRVPQPLARLRGRPRSAAPARRERPPGRRRGRRLPARAQAPR